MFIELRVNSVGQLRRSDMFQTMDCPTSQDIPLLRSLRNILPQGAIDISSLRDSTEAKSCSRNKR